MKTIAAVLTLFAAACGDNLDNTRPDGSVDSDAPIDAPPPQPPRAVVAAGDFGTTGLLSVLDVDARTVDTNVAPATAVGGDPFLRRHGDELFVINRTANNVTILSTNDYSLVEQLGTGAGSNPQDVAIDGDKVFVAVYGEKGLIEMTRGSATITEIDLSADDPDGKPNCASVYKVGDRLFVTCQILDDANMLRVRDVNGKVYVVDIATRAIVHELTLSTKNPFSLLEQIPEQGTMHPGDLIVGTVDFTFGMNFAGCIERITTGTTPTAPGCLVTNTAMGGFASRLEVHQPPFTGPVAPAHIIPSASLFVLVPRADFSGGDVRTISLGDNALAAEPYTTAGQALQDVAVCTDGEVIVAENPPFGAPATAPQGVRVYTAARVEATTTAINIGLKPQSSRGLVCY